jgi:hypothetical protein
MTNKFVSKYKLLLKTYLNGKNLAKAINTYAIPVFTYSFGIIKWSPTDIKNLNIKIRTLFTKYNKHHPKSALERICLSRKYRERGILSLQFLLNNQISKFQTYFNIKKDTSLLHKAVVEADKNYTPLKLGDVIIKEMIKFDDIW